MQSSIAGTKDQKLYRSAREGNFTYKLAVPNGRYRVTLKMSELSVDDVNARVFNINVNDSQLSRNIDLRARTGQRLRSYDVRGIRQVQDGAVTIHYTPKMGEPILSGIVIERL